MVISNSAAVFNRKDGSGLTVKVTQEIALQPGVATFERYFDPKEDHEVKVQGMEAVEYPKFSEFAPVTLRLKRYKVQDARLIVQEAETIS